jgi:protein-tyrosine phosphatase
MWRISIAFILFFLYSCDNTAIPVIPSSGNDVFFPRIAGNIENEIVRDYLNSVSYDDDYTYTKVLDYCNVSTDWDKSCPSPIIVTIADSIINVLCKEGIDSIVIQTYKDDILFREDSYELCNKVPVYNLIPDQEYYYMVLYKGGDNLFHRVGCGYIETEGAFRAIYVEGMHNFRDIGGYSTNEGKRIKYDRLFRSAELQRKLYPFQGDITQSGINEIIYNLKIDVELDFGDAYTETPIQDEIEFVSGEEYNITYYDKALNPQSSLYTGNRIKNCFDLIIEKLRQNKKVLFHCNAGADRTGTLAFILEALLGVNESDMAKDYELTSFFMGHIRRRDEVLDDRGCGYPSMIDYINKHFNGKNINDKVENMMLSFGVNQKQIEEFREIMLEDVNNTPSNIKRATFTEHCKNSSLNGCIFNLSGVRISQLQHGINIVNGLKMLK